MATKPASPRVARLAVSHAGAYRALMLEAYAREPDAFTSTPEERAALPASWWEKRLGAQEDALAFGAFDGAELVGAIVLERGERAKTRHKGHIVGMYVRQAHRGRGLGGALFQAAMDAARADGAMRVVTLTVSEGNAGAQALYERFGFRAFGTEPMAIAVEGRFIGKVHMACELRAGETEASHGE
jgi:ribosomal protein S18 acetylase RimI-like enzyme